MNTNIKIPVPTKNVNNNVTSKSKEKPASEHVSIYVKVLPMFLDSNQSSRVVSSTISFADDSEAICFVAVSLNCT